MSIRRRSPFEISPSSTIRADHSVNGRQCSDPNSTTGKCSILCVWISVSASKSSSFVPQPPGAATNPSEARTKQTFLA